MAAAAVLPLLFLFIVSGIPESLSQSFSPQNIQTFYPFSPPTVVVPPRPSSPVIDPQPQPTFPAPSAPRRGLSKGAAVGRAIGVTAASTLVVSGLLFFLLLQRSRRKRVREDDDVTHGGTTPSLPPPQADNFRRVSGNLRGVIVDENGLDILYWRNLQDDETMRSFKKQNYRSLKDEQRQEIKRIVSDKDRKNTPPVQEAPLLRGMSSSSQSPIWGQKEEIQNQAMIDKVPSISPAMAVRVEVNRDSSINSAKGKQPASQIPPPPPSQPVEAVPAVPPAVPKNKAPPPPPPKPKQPPGPRTASSNSIAEGSSSSTGNGQVKLKPLHWDKVNANVQHSMVWDKIDKGSFRFDGDLMEALFGYVAVNKKSPRGDSRSSSDLPPAKIFILDPRKSQNTAIVLKSVGISRQEIIEALIEGQGLSSDTIEKLTRIAPTDEEISQILAFNGEPAKLADAESFLYYLLRAVPSAFPRLNAMLFRMNHDAEVSSIKDSWQTLESACMELRTRGLFLKLLEAVLKAGNRLNAGTARGNAQAFNLTALTRLSDVKSSDGKTTLLQFVVQEVIRAEGKRCVLNRNRSLSRTGSQSSSSNGLSQTSEKTSSKDDSEREYMILGLPVIGGLSVEFSNVKKAATIDYDLLVKTHSSLAAQLVKIRETLEQCGDEGGFVHEMTGFLDTAESEMKALKEEQARAMELVKKTTDYYQAGASKGANSFQLFVIVRDFLQMVDQVCLDIARNVQKRRPASSTAGSSSSSGSTPPRVFRFPRLPANFMSDDSKSSLDDDSEIR